jgi:hypothetical protein
MKRRALMFETFFSDGICKLLFGLELWDWGALNMSVS